ncbi:efflux RND transporter periplasmic adaptor subunit [Winogradskyella sp.]|uniref:efflux RND transporter periplasmic adaptor subunit n=1 Tax=Winogradskyella sp. TaxID=1883156 RepID=UPI002623FD24|nr:efflux RND transporter periplasmic adaptor subunit [Winogradskyella sp.]
MKSTKNIALITLVSLLVLACDWEYPQQKPIEEKPVRVKTITLKEEVFSEYKTYYGELKFSQATSFVAQQSGIVTTLKVSPGQKVRRGETIATYPPINHQLQIDQARIAQRKTEQDYVRQQELLKAGAVSKVSVDAYRSELEVQTKVVQQLQNINTIRAPFSGIITQVMVNIDEEVSMGQALFSMAKTADVEVDFYVSPQDINKVAIGATTHLMIADKKLEGKITKTAIQLDPKRKAFQVTASFKNSGLTFAGSHAKVELETGKLPSSIWIPVISLKQLGSRHYVFLVDDGKAIEKTVKVGQRKETSVQIIDGLNVGQRLITDGSEKVEKNTLVKIIQ